MLQITNLQVVGRERTTPTWVLYVEHGAGAPQLKLIGPMDHADAVLIYDRIRNVMAELQRVVPVG